MIAHSVKQGETHNEKEMIKRKEGVCNVEGCKRPVYSRKMCQSHYWEDNKRKNDEKKKSNGKSAEKLKSAKELNIFFASQLIEVPDDCENCGISLKWLKTSKLRKTIIAHILPKRPVGGFPSVATHPKNKLFLCGDCHTNFDNKGAEFATTMNCFDLMCERFMEFENELSESDKQRLPFYFKDLLNIKY